MRRITGSSSTTSTLASGIRPTYPLGRGPFSLRVGASPPAPRLVGDPRPVALVEMGEPAQAVGQPPGPVARQPEGAGGLDNRLEVGRQRPPLAVGHRRQPTVG